MVERKGMRRERRNPYTYKTGIMEHNNNDFFKERVSARHCAGHSPPRKAPVSPQESSFFHPGLLCSEHES